MANRSLAGGARARARLRLAVVVVAVAQSFLSAACRRDEPAPGRPRRHRRRRAALIRSRSSIRRSRPSRRLPPRRARSAHTRRWCRSRCGSARRRSWRRARWSPRSKARARRKRRKDWLTALRYRGEASAELEHQVKGELADRVRICVGQDGPLDPEWNLAEASLASLGAVHRLHPHE